MALIISSLSKVDVMVPTTMNTPTGPGNPSGQTVQLAFIAGPGNPQATDWITGAWEQTFSGGWACFVVVGPGGQIQLTPGDYFIWRKITGTTEIPVETVGTLEVV